MDLLQQRRALCWPGLSLGRENDLENDLDIVRKILC